MAPGNYPLLLYYIRFISVLLLVPVAHHRDQKGNATGEKDNAAAETKYVIVSQVLRDEEDGA